MWGQRPETTDSGNDGTIMFAPATGGNRVLIREERDAQKYATVSILEVIGSALTRQEIIDREMNWQIKLGSRAKRLDDE